MPRVCRVSPQIDSPGLQTILGVYGQEAKNLFCRASQNAATDANKQKMGVCLEINVKLTKIKTACAACESTPQSSATVGIEASTRDYFAPRGADRFTKLHSREITQKPI
jgi:hypothetical protein